IFFAVFYVLNAILVKSAYWIAERAFHYYEPEGWSRSGFFFEGSISTAVLLFAAWVMSRLSGAPRSFADYGLPRRGAFGSLFWEGVLWGFVTSAVVLVMIWAAGGASFHGLAAHGSYLVTELILWGLAFLILAFFEEFFFRGYSLSTLASGMGFWPAAILLSLLFGAMHFFSKPMENWIDVTSVTLYGLFWAFTVRRTGNL